MWNVFNRMPVAKQVSNEFKLMFCYIQYGKILMNSSFCLLQVLKEEKKYGDLNEVAKLFSIHEE